jgi:aspartyl-tRNA(Asn)/glutamyl-tRNA(Gln) amidotransferase subunit A
LRFAPSSSLDSLFDPPRSLKILAVEVVEGAPLDPGIRASFRQMVELLQSTDHEVVCGELPLDIGEITEHWASIGQVGLGLLLQREPGMRRLASRKYVEWGETQYDATHLLKVMETITALRNQAAGVFEEIDIIMTPTCAAMPWPTTMPFPPEIDNQSVGPRGSAVYTGWVNACGHPAISVPGRTGDGSMPIGVQFVGDFGGDELLLRLAQQIEKKQSWLEYWPDLAFSVKS